MGWPLLLMLLGGTGAAVVADQELNDGDAARAVGNAFAGAAGDLTGGATEYALEPIIRMALNDDTLAEEIAEAVTSGEFDRAMDLFMSNLDQINYAGFAGLISGGVLANSLANSFGLEGVQKLALIAPVAGLAATAVSRLWSAVGSGDITLETAFEDGNIWNAIMQGQEEGTQAAVEHRQQAAVQPSRERDAEPA